MIFKIITFIYLIGHLHDEEKLYPLSVRILDRYEVKSLPAKLILSMAWGRAYPSYMGTTWVTPSPESKTIPVVLPDAYSDNTAWMLT